ncbi:hypothetical protein [Natrononativus amylolyticus]|uniref:hypothetical protein n=1 Tax=Natrononativus amylolyticus TaxID=2963434 RepID=UPI0020CD19A7|nr:hypothetical protein [Natrononativus amylolyticus]
MAIRERFGSWNQAKEAAELETVKSVLDKPPNRRVMRDGYVRFRHNDGESQKRFYEHRLMATLLVDDISELDGKHVHHRQNVPWLNTLDNLQVVSPAEHVAIHAEAD